MIKLDLPTLRRPKMEICRRLAIGVSFKLIGHHFPGIPDSYKLPITLYNHYITGMAEVEGCAEIQHPLEEFDKMSGTFLASKLLGNVLIGVICFSSTKKKFISEDVVSLLRVVADIIQ